ncbi:hypothetical protein GQ457_10G017820 [Hibiscus cannabinus]
MAEYGNGPDGASTRKRHERTRTNRPLRRYPCGNQGRPFRSNGTSSDLSVGPSHPGGRTDTQSNRVTFHERTSSP